MKAESGWPARHCSRLRAFLLDLRRIRVRTERSALDIGER